LNQNEGITHVSCAEGSDKLSIVLVIFAVTFLGEKLALRDVVGISLITIGGVLLATSRG